MRYDLIFRSVILLFLAIAVIFAQEAGSTAGTSSALLLRFEPSTRISGLSGAFSGLADDENAIFYNPAGLAYLDRGMVTLNHTEWFEDIRIENMMAGYNLFRNTGVGVSVTHMWMPEIQGRDAEGVLSQPVHVSSSILTAAIAYQLAHGFNMGLAAKYFYDKLATYSASGVGFDFGLHLKTFIDGLYTGLVVQNIGADISYYKARQKIPMTFRLGFVYKTYSPHINFLLDGVKSIDSDPHLHLGVEYIVFNRFFIRLGNQFTRNNLFTPAAGIGYDSRTNIYFNYTFALYSDLGATHRAGIGFYFNNPDVQNPNSKFQE